MNERSQLIIDLVTDGLTYTDAGAQVGVSSATVHRTLKAHAPDLMVGTGHSVGGRQPRGPNKRSDGPKEPRQGMDCAVCGGSVMEGHTVWTHSPTLDEQRRSASTTRQQLHQGRLVFTSERNS